VGNLTVGYNAAGNITQKSDVGPYTYGSAARPHAVTAAGAETYVYDANGNMVSRNGAAQQWSSFNLPVLLQKSGYSSQFAYGPDHQRWRQVATYPNGTETTIYVGSLLEKESATSTGLTYWRHYVPLPDGSTAVVSRNTDGSSSTSFVLTDHLGSSDTVLADTGSLRTRESFGGYGGRRGQDWNALTPPDWLGIANVTRQGFTAHEMLDNVGSVHMNGRVYDSTLGRFLSVDPLIGDVGDSQAVNPYAYVGNRPLTAADPSGLQFVPVPGGPCGGVCESIIASVIVTVLGTDHRPALPPQPATALPGQSAQNGVGMCGAGTFSPACNGMILYAGAPAAPSGGPETSTWAGSADDPYAQENLELFLRDLGINAIDVLILAPYYDVLGTIDAASEGKYGLAILNAGMVVCDVYKPCTGAAKPLRGLRKATVGVRRAATSDAEVVQRAMSRAELAATLETGKLRGGRPGTHYVSDAVNSTATRARARLALPTRPEVRATLEVPAGVLSAPSTVAPYRLPDGTLLKGGGTERSAVGDITVRVLKVDEL
jgi:RHS repeat-associated protein